ncbi:MAG TPA: aminotransferase class V-fold PLP-dependent enzyme [Syntrophobacter fumaroxidans]|nr:aminotransferase class V-fold PLP-dependent enzyme [Syntrophobacter fumaroxidans]
MKSTKRYRAFFPVTDRYAFLNHAAVSASSLRVRAAVESFLDALVESGPVRYGEWMEGVAEARRRFGRLINAEPGEIAFTGNTSDGLSIVAEGLDWKPGDAVLVPMPDFPANVYPWLNLERLGVEMRFYRKNLGRFGPAELEEAFRPGVRLLAVSSVDYSTGFRCDLEAVGEFCREKGILFCVDAIQSLGAFALDVRKCGIHFLAAGAHKWLLGLMGSGALFISRDADEMVRPRRVGWRSVVDENNFETLSLSLKKDALRFETGTGNVAGILGLGAALGLLLEVGVDTVSESILALNDRVLDGLRERSLEVVSPLEKKNRSGIVSFIPPGNPEELFDFFNRRNVCVSHRGRYIRLSPHFYNNAEDIDAFLDALDAYRHAG